MRMTTDKDAQGRRKGGREGGKEGGRTAQTSHPTLGVGCESVRCAWHISWREGGRKGGRMGGREGLLT